MASDTPSMASIVNHGPSGDMLAEETTFITSHQSQHVKFWTWSKGD